MPKVFLNGVLPRNREFHVLEGQGANFLAPDPDLYMNKPAAVGWMVALRGGQPGQRPQNVAPRPATVPHRVLPVAAYPPTGMPAAQALAEMEKGSNHRPWDEGMLPELFGHGGNKDPSVSSVISLLQPGYNINLTHKYFVDLGLFSDRVPVCPVHRVPMSKRVQRKTNNKPAKYRNAKKPHGDPAQRQDFRPVPQDRHGAC